MTNAEVLALGSGVTVLSVRGSTMRARRSTLVQLPLNDGARITETG